MVNIELQLPNDWFKEEIRNGYTITQTKKEIWAIELDMLYKVQQICDKYNIKYWVDGGTLLGAVRHKGFIPWDDDIDIMMLRDDYDKFIKVAQTELSDPYFLQTDWTDNVFYCHAKIRRSDTTCVLEKDLSAKFEFNQGIFIDIFPFDNVPTDETLYKDLISHLNLIKTEMLAARTRWWVYEQAEIEILNRCQQLRDKYDIVRKYYNDVTCDVIGNLGLASLKNDIRKLKKELNATIYMDFEILKVPVPIGYHDILTRIYGDYMKLKQNASKHGKLLFDTNISYKKSSILDLPQYEEIENWDEYWEQLYYQQYGWQTNDYSQKFPIIDQTKSSTKISCFKKVQTFIYDKMSKIRNLFS